MHQSVRLSLRSLTHDMYWGPTSSGVAQSALGGPLDVVAGALVGLRRHTFVSQAAVRATQHSAATACIATVLYG